MPFIHKIQILFSLFILGHKCLFASNLCYENEIKSINQSFDLLQYDSVEFKIARLIQNTNKTDTLKTIKLKFLDAKLNYKLKNFTKAYDVLSSILKYCQNGNLCNVHSECYRQLSIIFSSISEIEISRNYIHLADSLSRRQPSQIQRTLVEMTYLALFGDNNSASKYLEAADIFKNQGDNFIDEFITCKFNYALIEMDSAPDTALAHFKEIINISNANRKLVPLCNALSCNGELFFNKEMYDSALSFFNQSIQVGEKINDIEVLAKTYRLISELHSRLGDYRMGYDYLSKSNLYQDRVSKRIILGNNLLARHRDTLFVKNSHINSLLIEKSLFKTKTRLTILIFSSALIILICSIYILWLRNKNKLKLSKIQHLEVQKENETLERKNLLMEKQQKELELQSRIEGYQAAQKSIAIDLHDQVANTIAAIKLKLETISNSLGNESLVVVINALNSVYVKIRNISKDLYSNDDIQYSIYELLFDFISDFQTVNNISVSWSVHPIDEFSKLTEKVASSMYIIIRELFLNTLKHANATEVNLNINIHGEEILMIFNDNGKGFDFNLVEKSGIRNLINRVEELKGKVNIDSSGGGSIFVINIPIH